MGSFDILDFNTFDTIFYFQGENLKAQQILSIQWDFTMTTLREISQIFELNCFIYVSESFALYSAPHHKSEEEYRSL